MSFDVTLEDENGNQIAVVVDPVGVPIARSVSRAVGPPFLWTGTIDPYGNTTFNYLQVELLRKEWAILIREAGDEDTKAVLQQVDKLLQKCVSGKHLYVKFYGD